MGSLVFRSALVMWAVVVVLSFSCLAQSRINSSGTGGIHSIQGKIYGIDGSRTMEPIKVTLESSYTELSLYTDQSGSYSFTNLAPGSYTVTVDAGKDYEVFHDSVLIDSDSQSASSGNRMIQPVARTFNVPVYLQPKRGVAADPKAAVLNAKYSDMPSDVLKHFENGQKAAKHQNQKKALVEFQAVISAYPKFEPAYVEEGKIYLTAKDLANALPLFEKAIALEPGDAEAQLNYGVTLYNIGRGDAAEAPLTIVTKADSKDFWAHYYLGLIFIGRRDLDKAMSEMEAAEKTAGDRKLPTLHRALGGIYLAKKLNDKAAGELELYLKLAPEAADAKKIRDTIQELRKGPNT